MTIFAPLPPGWPPFDPSLLSSDDTFEHFGNFTLNILLSVLIAYGLQFAAELLLCEFPHVVPVLLLLEILFGAVVLSLSMRRSLIRGFRLRCLRRHYVSICSRKRI